MHVLGITAFHRDSAAALLRDGELLAVLAEERFTRNPHEAAFPRRAVRACLARAGIEPHELDAVVLAEKPSRCFERLLQEELAHFPRSWRSFPSMQSSWLGERLWARGRVATEIGVPGRRVLFAESQRARAAWALLATRADRAALLVSDEAREWATTTLALGERGAIEVLAEVHAPHGLCRFAAEAAQRLGLGGIEDLPRLAALAERGEPRRREALASVLAIAADGSHTLALAGLAAALGDSAADAAASVIAVLGDALLAAARELERRTQCEELCLGGELAGLSVLHARLLEEGPFRRVFAAPAAGEVGAAAGAALLGAQALGAARARPLEHPFLGEDLLLADDAQAQSAERGALEQALEVLAEGGRVGWLRGRAELGRRAFGHRSLLADPRSARADERTLAVPLERAQELFALSAAACDAARLVPLRVRGGAELHVVEVRAEPALHELLTRFGARSGRPLLLELPLGRPGEPSVRREIDARELLQRGEIDLLCSEDRVLRRSIRAAAAVGGSAA
jgi:carbamoyltransferase